MLPIFAALAEAGLSIIGNAVLAKGKAVVEEKLGVKIPDNPTELTPEKVSELAKAQMTHQEFLVNAAIKEYELELKDRDSARQRDAAVLQSGRRNVRGDYLAYAAVGALVVDLIFLSFLEVPRGNRDLLLVILGALIAIVKDVYGFEFGSSKSNERSAQAIADRLRSDA